MKKVAFIHLTGIIGVPREDEDPQNFVQLADLTSQFEKAKKEAGDEAITHIHMIIESPGGNIVHGDMIHEFFTGLKKDGMKMITESKNIVGSMATKIFMLGDERIIHEGDDFFIHNPQGAPQGDSKDVQAFLDTMKEVEGEMVQFYTEATGSEAKAIELLMDDATTLTAEQAKDMGFATEAAKASEKVELELSMILGPDDYKTIKTKKTTNPNIMSKFLEGIKKDLNAFKAELRAEFKIPTKTDVEKAKEVILEALKVKFKDLTDFTALKGEKGDILIMIAPDAEMIGAEAVTMVEKEITALEDGEHKLADGKTMVILEGKITELKEAESELDALKAKNAKLEAEKKALEEAQVDPKKLDALVDEKMKPILEKAAKSDETKAELEAIQSHYKVPENKTFRRESSEPTMRERLAARKAEYNPIKTTADQARESLN